MARWKRGEAEIEALIASADLQKLTGDAANGRRLVEKASVTLQPARSAEERDPDSAFVLAYDAARQALIGLLAQQGLRPTTKGATTRSSKQLAPSSARASVRSARYEGDATNSNTPSAQATTPPLTEPPTRSRTPRRAVPLAVGSP